MTAKHQSVYVAQVYRLPIIRIVYADAKSPHVKIFTISAALNTHWASGIFKVVLKLKFRAIYASERGFLFGYSTPYWALAEQVIPIKESQIYIHFVGHLHSCLTFKMSNQKAARGFLIGLL